MVLAEFRQRLRPRRQTKRAGCSGRVRVSGKPTVASGAVRHASAVLLALRLLRPVGRAAQDPSTTISSGRCLGSVLSAAFRIGSTSSDDQRRHGKHDANEQASHHGVRSDTLSASLRPSKSATPGRNGGGGGLVHSPQISLQGSASARAASSIPKAR